MSRFKSFIEALTKSIKDEGLQSDHPAYARINEDLQYASIQNRIRRNQAQAEHRAKSHNA
jgi:hypothetical protein